MLAALGSALAISLLLGETDYHHLQGRPYNKHRLVRTASK